MSDTENWYYHNKQKMENWPKSVKVDSKDESITISLDNKDLIQLTMIAHEQDITLNSLIRQILRDAFETPKEENTPVLLNENGN